MHELFLLWIRNLSDILTFLFIPHYTVYAAFIDFLCTLNIDYQIYCIGAYSCSTNNFL